MSMRVRDLQQYLGKFTEDKKAKKKLIGQLISAVIIVIIQLLIE